MCEPLHLPPRLSEPPRPALYRRPPLTGAGGISRSRAPPASRGIHQGHSEVSLFLQHHLSHPINPFLRHPNQTSLLRSTDPVFFSQCPQHPGLSTQKKKIAVLFFSLLWLRLCTSNAGGMGLIPSPRIKIPQAVRHGQKSKK